MKLSKIFFYLDALDDIIRCRRHLMYRNHKGEEMLSCFNPAFPFNDVCLSFDQSIIFCRHCYKEHDMVDYIE